MEYIRSRKDVILWEISRTISNFGGLVDCCRADCLVVPTGKYVPVHFVALLEGGYSLANAIM